MSIPFIDLKTQYQALKPQIQARIDAVLEHGHAIKRHVEQPARLDGLKSLVEERGAINGDLSAHLPRGMLERLGSGGEGWSCSG